MLILLGLLLLPNAQADDKKIEVEGCCEMMVMGGLEKAVIKEYLQRHDPQFRSCYDRNVISKKPVKGRVAVRFVIDKSGRVSQVGITSSSLKNKKTEKCVSGVVKNTIFPEPDGGGVVEVDYAFEFPLSK